MFRRSPTELPTRNNVCNIWYIYVVEMVFCYANFVLVLRISRLNLTTLEPIEICKRGFDPRPRSLILQKNTFRRHWCSIDHGHRKSWCRETNRGGRTFFFFFLWIEEVCSSFLNQSQSWYFSHHIHYFYSLLLYYPFSLFSKLNIAHENCD